MSGLSTSKLDRQAPIGARMLSGDRPLRVLMIGEGLDRQGGIVTVQKLILGMADGELAFRHVATLRDGSVLRKTRVFLQAVVQLIVSLLTRPVDIVHIHVSLGGSVYRQVVTGGITLLAGKPLVMHAHAGEFPEFFARLPGVMQRLTTLVFRRAARVVVLSEHWRTVYRDLLGLAPERLAVLTNPVAIPEALPARAERPVKRLLYLGRMSEPKGAFDLVRAIGLLPEASLKATQLTLAGDGETETIRALVRSLDLEASITVRDWVGPAERDALLEAADIFLLPSYFEGMPMALLEAMSWGLACIATPVGGIPDILRDGVNGILVPAGDHAALARAIDRLIHEPAGRLALGRAARNDMLPYAIDRYASRLRQLYAEVAR
ncbi:MAG: glycosyltransferase family 4 protein [Alphaproteobacteria bacterium]